MTTLKNKLNLNYFQADDVVAGVRNFSKSKTEKIISTLLEYDMKLKGVDDNGTPDFELGKELLYKIIY